MPFGGFDLVGMDLAEKRRKAKFTVLQKSEGNWDNASVSRLTGGLGTECNQLPSCPGSIILWGEYTAEAIANLLGQGSCTHKIVVGFDNPELPFKPHQF